MRLKGPLIEGIGNGGAWIVDRGSWSFENQLVSIVTCGTQGSSQKRTERRLAVYFRLSYFGPLSRRSSHRLVSLHLVGFEECSSVVPAWVEDVGNGVGPLHRKVDQNLGASKGPKGLQRYSIWVESGPLAETLINSVVFPTSW
jgi:hypothetical protein